MKTILVSKERTTEAEVAAYLPANYKIADRTADHFIVTGEDHAGWTAEGYVIPRLQSGWLTAVLSEELLADY
tara:strand:+ start:495 stop:710 length:216 start_codon:yes stop_codon:yes gene_type:complete